tara:strand:- start:840 stop:1232 length:393 start_codon:yes stop_codon:yes gene_type:complete
MKLLLSQLTPALRGTLQPQIVALVGERFWDTPFAQVSDLALAGSYHKFCGACLRDEGLVPGLVADFITDRMGSPTAITDVGIALAALEAEGITLEAADTEATPQVVRDAQFAAILHTATTTTARSGDGNY